jgi:TRAP-type mannitol/chloroaromatic compound transport system permease small subunit
MLGTSYTLKKNEHVRVDIVYANVSTRRQMGIDIFGFILFMLPATMIMDLPVRGPSSTTPGTWVRSRRTPAA